MATKSVAIVGLGYVGLPLAVLAAEKGWHVIGIDTDTEKVAKIQRQESPMEDERLAADLKRFPITATTDFAQAATASVVIIAVPTPVTDDHEPDLQPLISAVEELYPYLLDGQVVVVESTINPGVIEEVVLPLLKEKAVRIHVAHCPERINPGDPKWSVRNIPRVIGALTPTGLAKAAAFYESIIEAPIKRMASVTEAEAVKILENTFRDINIAFINEMAKSFAKLGIDVTHVIAGATTKPFAFMPHYPGNGVGGHCISVDPYYMIERARQVGFDHEFLKLAREINNSMPEYTVELMRQGLERHSLVPKEATVALLGLAYKKNIDDIRESPALVIHQLLKNAGVTMRVFDPYIPHLSTVAATAEALENCTVIMLATDHTAIVDELTPAAIVATGARLVIDGKNALDGPAIAAAGVDYYGIGRQYLAK